MSCMVRRCEGNIRSPNFSRYAGPCSRKMSATSSISHSRWQVVHELVDGRGAELFGLHSQVRVDVGGGRSIKTQPLLNQAQVDARFQQMGGPGVAQRVHRRGVLKPAGVQAGAE